mgnify:CR=1 FL=1
MPANEKAFLEIEGGDNVPCLFKPAVLALSRNDAWAADSMPG